MNSNTLSSSLIFLDTRDRNHGTASNCKLLVSETETANSQKNVSIQDLQLLYSFYSINENNDTFLINSTPIVLNRGNYSSAQFLTELTAKLNASLVDVFTTSINPTTNQLIINGTIGGLSITSNGKNNRYLGLPKNTVKLFVSNVFTSDYPIDLSGTRYIEIQTDLPISSINSRDGNNNILARVYINCQPFEFIQYNSSSFQFIKLLTKKINSIGLTLVDDNQDEINLNGHEYSITLEIQEYF